MLYTHNAMAFFAVIKFTAVGLRTEFQEYTQFNGQKEKNWKFICMVIINSIEVQQNLRTIHERYGKSTFTAFCRPKHWLHKKSIFG